MRMGMLEVCILNVKCVGVFVREIGVILGIRSICTLFFIVLIADFRGPDFRW